MMSSLSTNMCCSFELEPQTLSEGQLNRAREVAQNQEPTKASTTLSNQQEVIIGDDARKRVRQKGEQLVEKVELHGCTQHNKDHTIGHCISTSS